MAAGPAGLALAVTQLGAASPPPAPTATAEVEQGGNASVEEFAARLVVDWLQTRRGDEARLEEYGLRGVSTRQPDEPQRAVNPAVAAVEQVEPGLWSVTVGVTVIDPLPADLDTDTADPEPQLVGDRRYFQVAIEHDEAGRLAAQTLPAPVPQPPVTPATGLDYRDRAMQNHPAASTVAGFLSALLAGAGDIERYLAPGTVIPPITPNPYLEVELTSLSMAAGADRDQAPADGEELHVLATATARTHADQLLTTQYPLTLAARAGRWEVSALAPAAIRAGRATQGAPDPTEAQ